MAMYSFVPPFRKAKFCGVPSCVFDKLGCAAGEKRLRNTAIELFTTERKAVYSSKAIMSVILTKCEDETPLNYHCYHVDR
jgi:hypothetical protein